MKQTGTVTSKGQLVIPAEMRRALGIEKGMRVRFERIKGGIAIFPEQDPIDYYCGILGGRGFPTDFEREPDREID